MSVCFIAFGSNLDEPVQQVIRALITCAKLPNLTLLSVSSLYSSPPLGWVAQPNFINCIAKFETTLIPMQLLDFCEGLESEMGRVKQGRHRWGARIIDLDILLYDQKHLRNDRLTIPHPGMTKRDFVLFPLLEIEPNLMLPDGSTLITHCSRCENQLELILAKNDVMTQVNEQLIGVW